MINTRRIPSRIAVWIVVLLCLFSFSMMLWASRTDSAIDDELAHIPAGYGYVHNLDYRLNPEHPPLVKALAMAPVLFLNPVFPTENAAWTTAINGQWDMGRAFLYGTDPATGQPINDATAIIQWARVMPILLTILTIIFVFLLARRLLGDIWALLPAALFALSPTVLAHGHYVTTDIGATFGIVFATYFFLNFLQRPPFSRISSFFALFLAGLAFGVAQIAKFSTPFLIPLFIFIAFILWLRNVIAQRKILFTRGARLLLQVCAIFAIGYIFIVYPVYFLFTAHYPINRQVSDTTTILTSFATGPTPAGQLCHGMRCLADFDIWAAHSPVLRPFAEYLLGLLMVLQRSAGGNTIYFLGHVVNAGGWIYFPVLYLLKEPIPTLIIVLTALIFALWNLIKSLREKSRLSRLFNWLDLHIPECTMASFIVLYWSYSMHSPLNIGIRHILPTLPFIYILAASVWKNWTSGFNIQLGANPFDMLAMMSRSVTRTALKYTLLIGLVLWLFLETAIAAPYFLSYFNEFGGGVGGGYHYVTDSNYDWGQDLLRLQKWVGVHPEIDRIAVDYFGGGDPKYYLGTREVDWSPSKGNPAALSTSSTLDAKPIHWLAISINQLEGATQPLAGGQTRNPNDEYGWLTALRPPMPGMGNVPKPDYRVGTTIFVYKL